LFWEDFHVEDFNIHLEKDSKGLFTCLVEIGLNFEDIPLLEAFRGWTWHHLWRHPSFGADFIFVLYMWLDHPLFYVF
jgi:hypothetical protein